MSGFKMDVQHWLYGLIAALVGGGAGGVVTALSGAVTMPGQVNLGTGLHAFLMLFYVSFAMHGLISVAFYLQKSPLPAIEDTTTIDVSKITQPGKEPQIVTKISETHTETK